MDPSPPRREYAGNRNHFLQKNTAFGPAIGNLDHIVLGPNGIFVIETKNYTGRISCHGDNWYRAAPKNKGGGKIPSISYQVKSGAKALYTFLQKEASHVFKRDFVVPIIVFTNSGLDLKTKNPTVAITGLRKLPDVIQSHQSSVSYNTTELRRMAEIISPQPATHQPSSSDW